MTISKILYGHLPSIGTMLLFCALLGIFAIGAPASPAAPSWLLWASSPAF